MGKLAQLREDRGFTFREVALATGLTEQTIRNIESDPQRAIARNIDRLADFYGVTTDQLLGREQ